MLYRVGPEDEWSEQFYVVAESVEEARAKVDQWLAENDALMERYRQWWKDVQGPEAGLWTRRGFVPGGYEKAVERFGPRPDAWAFVGDEVKGAEPTPIESGIIYKRQCME